MTLISSNLIVLEILPPQDYDKRSIFVAAIAAAEHHVPQQGDPTRSLPLGVLYPTGGNCPRTAAPLSLAWERRHPCLLFRPEGW